MSNSGNHLDTPLSREEIDRVTRRLAIDGAAYVGSDIVLRLIVEVARLREANRQLIDLANTMSEAGPIMLNPFIDQEYADKIRELTDWKP